MKGGGALTRARHARLRRVVLQATAAGTAAALLTLGATTDAGASAAAGASGESLQTKAAALATEIQDQGTRIDQLAEQYDAAVIRRQAVEAELRHVGVELAATRHNVARAHRTLVEQAVAAYVSDGEPIPVVIPGHVGLDPSITQAYAAILSHTESQALGAYERLHRAQVREQARLRSEKRTAVEAVLALTGTRKQASAAETADESLLSQVKGQLATLVAADQRKEAAEQEAEEKAVLASEGQLPKSTPPTTSVTSTTTSTTPTTALATTTTTDDPTTTDPPTTDDPTTTTTTAPTNPPTTTPPGDVSPQAPGAAAALAYARAQLGKPYQWGGAGPDSFDCSGLVMRAWEAGGVDFPHLAQDQYDLTERISLADLLPGDLVFFGTPDDVYHVGMYIGGGEMIDAPETGQDVSIQSIYWPTLLGGGRVTTSS